MVQPLRVAQWSAVVAVRWSAIAGGCRDGLHPDRVNQNQGSESTLAFLMALLELRLGAVEDVSESAPLSAALLGADAATLQPMTASD